jgi:hypothetical protein
LTGGDSEELPEIVRTEEKVAAAECRALHRRREEGAVIQFHLARAGLWAAQREWMQASGPLLRVASHVLEELDWAERGLAEVEAALGQPCSKWQ